MSVQTRIWQVAGTGKQYTTQQRIRRAGSALLISVLASCGAVVAAAPASAAVQNVEFVSDADGVTTSWVRATRLEGTSPREQRLQPGWFICDSKVQRSSLAVVDSVDLILGDNCELTITNRSGEFGNGAGILVPEGSQLTIWSGVQNAGRLVATGAPFSAGIGGSGIPRSGDTPRSVSGDVRITGGTVIANGGQGAAGIGGGVLQANGRVTLVWRANVLAQGGDAYDTSMFQYGGGPGVGVGGRTFYSTHPGRGYEGPVQVNTRGVVQAIGGKPSRTLGGGEDIGWGGAPNSRLGANGTVSVSDIAVGQGGTVKVRDVNQTFLPAAPLTNIAPGSTVTFQVLPDAGMKLALAEWQGTEISWLRDDLYQLKIPRIDTASTAAAAIFSFVQASENAAAVQELSERIAALPDTIVSVSDADQVAAVTNLWLALNKTERETLPIVASNRLRGAQQQAAVVNHSDEDTGIRVSSAALDWNVRLLAKNFDRDSDEYVSARETLRDDRLAIALADVRYVDTLTGSDVAPDMVGTLSFSGLSLQAYDDISVRVQRADDSAVAANATIEDDNLRIESIAAGRYLLSGYNTSDGGAGKGAAAADPPEVLMIALACLVALAALATGGVVTQLSMRRTLRLVGK